jgi:hypothetical protein
MAWWVIAVFVVALIFGYSMIPKPESRPPAGLGDIKVPTAEEGREIPVLFGTKDVEGPNVVWYGDFAAKPVKAKGGKK